MAKILYQRVKIVRTRDSWRVFVSSCPTELLLRPFLFYDCKKEGRYKTASWCNWGATQKPIKNATRRLLTVIVATLRAQSGDCFHLERNRHTFLVSILTVKCCKSRLLLKMVYCCYLLQLLLSLCFATM